jgi:hypothetical protein
MDTTYTTCHGCDAVYAGEVCLKCQAEDTSRGSQNVPVDVRAVTVEAGMSFIVRAWFSHVAGGWFWNARAEDHDWAAAGGRAWATADGAHESAFRRLNETFA